MELFTKKKFIIGVGSVLGIMMIIGTFFDDQISSMLFHPESKMGIFLASYGQLFAMLCCSCGGILLIRIADRKKKRSCISCYVTGAFLQLFAILGITMDPLLYIDGMSWMLSMIIALVLVIGSDILILKLSQGADRNQIKQFIIIILTTMFLEIILINLIKIPWGRPRMRMIAEQSEAFFQPWWVIGSEMKEQLMALGVASEEFKSFPSGHCGNAACALLLSLLPLICTKLKGKESLLMTIGILFTLVVAVSRIVMGAHFLTDVTVGMSITFFIEVIIIHFAIHRQKKQIK